MTDIDTTAADMLEELITDLARVGVELHFAELKGHVKDRLRDYGIFERLGAEHFHPTVGMAVRAYLAAHPDVSWQDWESEPVNGRGAVAPSAPHAAVSSAPAAVPPLAPGGSAPPWSPGGSAAPRQPDEPGVDPPTGEA
jgi:hypothetical protein